MTKKILLTLAFALAAAYSRADVSDSGSLTIGGQAVIAGSMTVAGPISGSSVTLSTTGAASYALTSSTGIHILNGRVKLEPGSYIEWPDGKTSTTSSSGGSGAIGGGYEIFIASTSGNSVSSITFVYGFVSSATYTLYWGYTKDATAGVVYVTFNANNGANYRYTLGGDRQCSGWDASGADPANGCRITVGSNNADANQASTGDFKFRMYAGNRVNGWGSSTGWNAGCWGGGENHCDFNNTPTSVSIYSASGNFSVINATLTSKGP